MADSLASADRTEVVPQAPVDRTEVVPQAPVDRTEIVAHAPVVPPSDRTEVLPHRPPPADRTEILRPAGDGPSLWTDPAAAAPHTERVFAPPSPDTTLILGEAKASPPPRAVAAPPRAVAAPPRPAPAGSGINRALIWINVVCLAAILLLVLLLGLLS